jgi:hypothetical protein
MQEFLEWSVSPTLSVKIFAHFIVLIGVDIWSEELSISAVASAKKTVHFPLLLSRAPPSSIGVSLHPLHILVIFSGSVFVDNNRKQNEVYGSTKLNYLNSGGRKYDN